MFPEQREGVAARLRHTNIDGISRSFTSSEWGKQPEFAEWWAGIAAVPDACRKEPIARIFDRGAETSRALRSHSEGNTELLTQLIQGNFLLDIYSVWSI